MKLNKYSWLAALPLLFTACQDDMLVEKHSQQGIYTLSATVENGSASSRAQIVLNGTSTTKESFHWNEGDAFTLFELDEGNNVYTKKFTISDTYTDDSPMASADFTTTEALVVGRKFSAFYPQPVMNEESPYSVDLTLNNVLSDNSEESWVDYFKNNMFMMAQGTVSEPTAITFNQLCGIVRITYKNTSSEDRTIQGLYLSGSWGNNVGYSLDDLGITGGSSSGRHGLEFETPATISANSSEDFYVLFMQNLEPIENQIPLSYVEVQLSDGNYMGTPEYSETLPIFKIGKSYWLNITDDGDKLFWTNDQQGGDDTGDDNVTNEAIEVSTFDDLKAALNAPQQGDLRTYIHLQSNITLTEQLVVDKPVELIMNGHTLTLGYTLQEKEGAIINNSNLYISKEGIIEAPATGTEVDAYLIKSGSGMVDLRHLTINAGIVKNAVYIKDGKGRVYESATLNASGYTLDIESDYYSDVDIYTGTLNGDVRWKLNSAEYTELCRFGAGPNSTINGDLVWAGEYGGTATGYKIEFGSPVTINGENWVTTDDGSDDSENTDPSYAKVSTFLELKTALADSCVTYIDLGADIALDGPLSVSHTVTLVLMDYTMSLSSSYPSDASDVINVIGDDIRFMFVQGNVDCTANTTKLNNFIKLSGKSIDFQFADVVMNTGDYIGNAIYMDDDNLHMFYSQRTTDITALNAIYLVSNETNKGYGSYIDINGSINGSFFFQSNSGELNTHLEITEGTMNGELMFNGVNESVDKAAYIRYNQENVTFGTNAKGWEQAGILE